MTSDVDVGLTNPAFSGYELEDPKSPSTIHGVNGCKTVVDGQTENKNDTRERKEYERKKEDPELAENKQDEEVPSCDHAILGKLDSMKGVFCALLAAILFSVMSLAIKYASNVAGSAGSTLYRGVVIVVMAAVNLFIFRDSPVYGGKPLLFLSLLSLAGYLSTVTATFGYPLMNIGTANAILYTSPVISGVQARMVMKEPFGIPEFVVFLLCFVGVVLIAQPPFLFQGSSMNSEEFIGTAYMLGAAFFYATSLGLARFLVSKYKISPNAQAFYRGLAEALPSLIILLFMKSWPIPEGLEWIPVISSGICSFLANNLTVVAFRTENTFFINAILTTEVISSYLLEYMTVGDVPGWWECGGSILILLPIVWYFWSKSRTESNQVQIVVAESAENGEMQVKKHPALGVLDKGKE